MTRIFVLSDDGVATGFGRISMNVNTRLVKRGYQVMAASLAFDGLLPPVYDGDPLPYWVASLAGRNWVEESVKVINAYNPDIVMVIQDAPYAQALRNSPLDWSRIGFVVVTPVDGVPIYPDWVDTVKRADAALTISQFGVEAFRRAGAQVTLCRPGIDPNRFYRLNDEERKALRTRLGLDADNYIVGTASMNQGRKCISLMLEAFMDFAADKPHARYLMDMEETSPAGWDINALCKQFGYDRSKLLFRADCIRAGVVDMRERYNLMDMHMVVSHREGYGIPLVEAQACGVLSMALDYCSGSEICGLDEVTNFPRGVLIRPIDFTEAGTWGGALDRFPDKKHFLNRLQWVYDNPHERAAIAERGMEWSRRHTWDESADAVDLALQKVIKKRASIPPATVPLMALQAPTAAPVSVDGTKVVELQEAG
jgi:glycosyltransferase involved in cell wall biosynthesis